jgi:hypothetical protein
VTIEKTVATPHPDAEYMREMTKPIRAVMGGTKTMRDEGKTYLPKEAGESETAYEARLKRTVLFNALRKTVQDMTGRVFAKELTLEGGSAQFGQWAENIDATGRHISVFAAAVFQDALQAGVSYILADTPAVEADATRASQGQPYLVHLKAEDVIGWTQISTPDGLKLNSFRYYETVEEDDGIHTERVQQIKVLLPGSYEVWRKNDKKEWYKNSEGLRGIEAIPVAPVYLNQTGFMCGQPPLMDLADLNITHWQSSSDQRNILHVARVPILFASGVAEDIELVVGANAFMRASDPQARLEYVEHSGAAITSGKDDLKELEFQMQAMGLQLLQAEPAQTATGEVRDDVKENSRLGRMADALKDAMENALAFMAELGGATGQEPSVIINKDFGITARGAADIAGLLNAWQAGLLSAETVINEFVRRGFISDDITPEDEADRLLSEPGDNEAALRDALPPSPGVTPPN